MRAGASLLQLYSSLVFHGPQLVQEILAGKREGPISQATARAMLTPHLNKWGLGPATNKEGDSLRFGKGLMLFGVQLLAGLTALAGHKQQQREENQRQPPPLPGGRVSFK